MAPNPATLMDVIAASAPPQDHRVRVTLLDQTEGVTYRVRTARACCRGGRIRTLRVPADRNVPRCQIDDRGGYEERRDPPRPGLQELLVLALDDVEPTDAAAHVGPDTGGSLRSDPSSAIPIAYSLAASAKKVNRPILRASLADTKSSGSKSATLACQAAGKAVASKWVIGPMPLRPARNAAQVSSVPTPTERQGRCP